MEDYELWDLSATYRGFSNFTLRAGMKSVFDTKPPQSNQVYSFLAGYDPNYTDPRGRAFYASLAYSFK